MPPDTQFALGEERYLFPSLLRVSCGAGTQLSLLHGFGFEAAALLRPGIPPGRTPKGVPTISQSFPFSLSRDTVSQGEALFSASLSVFCASLI